MDLNEIIDDYKIRNNWPEKKGLEDELKYIKDYLRDVPVSLGGFIEALGKEGYPLEDMMTSVELHEPGGGGKCVYDSGNPGDAEMEEIEISSRIRLPFPRIDIDLCNVMLGTESYQLLLGQIRPEEGNLDVKILTSSEFENYIGIVSRKGEKIDYIEIGFGDIGL